MAHRNMDFVMSSGLLQAQCYKEEIEANMRTKSFSGFSLLGLQDYIGQCGALCGLVDALWEEKPYVKPNWFKRFNAPVVPLARVMKSVYTTSEIFNAELEMACYSERDMLGVVVEWKIMDEKGKTRISGKFDEMDIKIGGNTYVGMVSADLRTLETAAYKLVVGIENSTVENDWDIWVYAPVGEVSPVNVTYDFTKAVEFLKKGEDVLFIPFSENLGWNCPPLAWAPIFWNAQMGPQWCRPLGLWNDVNHPALADFPTSHGMGWQWKDIVQGTRAMNLEGMPSELQPFIQPIDDWNRNYKLALAFECKLHNGKMVVCSADLPRLAENNPVAAQLLYSLKAYMNSEKFMPAVETVEDHFKTFLFDTAVMQKLGVKACLVEGLSNEKLEPLVGFEAFKKINEKYKNIENIICGDPNQYWLAGGRYGGAYPFTIELEVPRVIAVKGICLMPRQDHRDMQGAVKSYEVWTSLDGENWVKQLSGELPASYNVQNLYFGKNVELSKLRVKLIDGFGANDMYYWQIDVNVGHISAKGDFHDIHASIAQIAFITDDIGGVEAKIKYEEGKTATEEIY